MGFILFQLDLQYVNIVMIFITVNINDSRPNTLLCDI